MFLDQKIAFIWRTKLLHNGTQGTFRKILESASRNGYRKIKPKRRLFEWLSGEGQIPEGGGVGGVGFFFIRN